MAILVVRPCSVRLEHSLTVSRKGLNLFWLSARGCHSEPALSTKVSFLFYLFWTRFTILDYNRLVHYNTGDDFNILYATLCLNINIFSHSVKFHTTPSTTNNCFTHLPSLKLFPLFRPSLKIINVVLCCMLQHTYKQVQQYTCSKYL